jgi:hypothetical protein
MADQEETNVEGTSAALSGIPVEFVLVPDNANTEFVDAWQPTISGGV